MTPEEWAERGRRLDAARQLEAWAEAHIGVYGGYFHLFPADGDARQELQEFWDEQEDEED